MPPHAPTARAGVVLDAVEILLAHLAGGERADRLERARRSSASCPFQSTRLDRAARRRRCRARSCAPSPSCRRACSCRSRRRRARRPSHWPLTEVSIASAITSRDTSEYFMRLGAHADAVGDGRHAEHLRHRARARQRRPSRGRPAAGCRRCTGSSSSGRWRRRRSAVEIVVAEADGAQHRAVRGARDAVGDEAGATVERHGGIPEGRRIVAAGGDSTPRRAA